MRMKKYSWSDRTRRGFLASIVVCTLCATAFPQRKQKPPATPSKPPAEQSLDIAQLVAQARANPIENFRLVFNDAFMKGVVGRMDENADLFRRILDDPQFQSVVMEHYMAKVFEQARTQTPAAP